MRSMPLLNEDQSYADIATPESRALFLGGSPLAKEPLASGRLLCRFEPRGAVLGTVCPWWILFDPIALGGMRVIAGIGEFLLKSGCRVQPQGTLHQPEGVRLTCVEPASRLKLVRLIQPVYAFMGPTVPQRVEPCGGVIALRGGEFRVWIPGLSSEMVQPVPLPSALIATQSDRRAQRTISHESDGCSSDGCSSDGDEAG